VASCLRYDVLVEEQACLAFAYTHDFLFYLGLQVSMFESDCPEFVVPEALFTWRLQSIENSSGRTRHQNELPIVAYFSSEGTARVRSRSNREDQEMEAFSGTLKKLHPNSEREPDDHLLSSGFGTLEVEWDSGEPSFLSPWEVTLKDMVYETPSPPALSEAATMAIAKALAKVEGLPSVEEYFLRPVDERRYSDYSNRVEIPMNFSFIKERLAAGYYSNVRSVLSDAKLIRENCLKYNGPSELSQVASDIYHAFEDEVKTHVDIDDSPVPASMSIVASDVSPVQDSNDSRSTRLARRRRQGGSTRESRPGGSEEGGTTLERLPMPEQRASSSRTTRRSALGTQNAEQSRRRFRSSPVLESAASRRLRRSGSSGSVLAMETEDGGDSDECKYDDFAADRDEHGDDSSEPEDSSESDSSHDDAPRRASRRTSRNTSGQHVARESGRAKRGTANAADISSSEEWGGEQNRSSEEEEEVEAEEEEEEEEADSSPQPSRRSRRLSTSESRQEERRASPRRSARASVRSAPDKEDSDTGGAPESGRASRSRRSTRRSSLADDTLDSPRRSTRSHESRSMADLSHSDVDQEESESHNASDSGDSEEEEPEPLVTTRRGALKRRSGKLLCRCLYLLL